MASIKEERIRNNMTQKQVAELVDISLRSYKTYENDSEKIGTLKYNYILEKLKALNPIDEEHGVLSVEEIANRCVDIFKNNDVEYVYLFGSYAKKQAGPKSDVDLLVSTNLTGLNFFGMVEEIRSNLNKKVDVLDVNQLNNNINLVKEILRDGIKIYG